MFKLFALLSLALPLAANAHVVARGEGTDLARRQSYSDARFTYYAVGLGACGETSQPSDFVVALDADLYDSGSECFKTITISANGKSTTATIVDDCPGCPYGGLDLSEGLFEFFAPLSEGVIYGDWSYNN